MGILRTDKISGLEKPTAVTGSVEFDGTGDYVTSSAFHISDSWTMEFWFNTSVNNAAQRPMNFSSDLGGSNYAYIELTSSGKIKARVVGAAAFGDIPGVSLNEWHHTALSYDGSTAYFVYDGNLVATQSVSYSNHSIQVRFGADESNTSSNLYTGYVSNARIVSGKALYTTNYTVPIHAFEATEGTNLLCLNNADSAAASEHGRIGAAPPTLTVTGDAAASSVSPGLTRDFTYGTEFKGVTTFDTQGYFVPPSSTTEQRFPNFAVGSSGGRALFTGGYDSPATINTIDYITVSTTGNAKDFGDLTTIRLQPGSLSSSTRGLIGGGRTPGVNNFIDYVTISSTGNGFDFGDLTAARRALAALSNSSRGIWAGGDSPSRQDIIDFVTISTTSNAVDFGDLSEATNTFEGCSSSTRGLLMGGENSTSPGGTNDISFLTIASLGNAQDFGDLTEGRRGPGSCSSSTRGLCGGGFDSPSLKDTIDFVTIASTGNATDFGNLTVARWLTTSTSNSIRGVWGGGYNPSPAAEQDVIDYVTIASTGNATDFGNLQTSRRSLSSCSDSHGGLS